ncbi:rhomboid family intramembrane serine protease [Cytophaga sp. FL35]|uniref:rhomboid family intramembrane serine protease n=1 Tax=Cytophaga sp. FL35 TaxID=1904456 RepID=UPI001653D5A7|nr:rhomboid family intramembrane serine protease [Cytophaga sp. FL35]MBC6999749.1 rhomboid family intramembrane serine protease [Cytophaga sp. FL35]
MSENHYFKFTNAVVIAPIFAVLAIWTVFYLEIKFQTNWNEFGIYPKTALGLRGILLSPFIHGSVEHLYNNTIPLAVLSASLFYFYRKIAWKVLIFGAIGAGLFTWGIGRSSYHIGASGIIYLLASFIFFKGIFTKHYRLVALSLMVVFIYGSMLWYIFPIEEGISWEGHLGGFVLGLVLAYSLKAPTPPVKKYRWEEENFDAQEDPFLKHFDEEGNFIGEEELLKRENEVTIQYHYKEGRDDTPNV